MVNEQNKQYVSMYKAGYYERLAEVSMKHSHLNFLDAIERAKTPQEAFALIKKAEAFFKDLASGQVASSYIFSTGRKSAIYPVKYNAGYSILGEAIRDFRAQVDISQAQLALDSNLGRRTIAEIERGTIANISKNTLENVLSIFNIDPAEKTNVLRSLPIKKK